MTTADQPEFNGQKALVRVMSTSGTSQLEVYDAQGTDNFYLMVRSAVDPNAKPIALGVWPKSVLALGMDEALRQSRSRALAQTCRECHQVVVHKMDCTNR